MGQRQTDEKLKYLKEYLLNSEKIMYWCYDTEGKLLSTNSSMPVFDKVFTNANSIEYIIDSATALNRPYIVDNKAGFIWCVFFEMEENMFSRLHVLGPVLSKELSMEEVNESLNNSAGKDKYAWRARFKNSLKEIPVVQLSSFYQNMVMFHFYLTGEKIQISNIHVQKRNQTIGVLYRPNPKDTLDFYQCERAVLQNIENGNMDYKNEFERYEMIYRNNKSYTSEIYGQIVFISLCTRAAIKGGLAADLAFQKGNRYSALVGKSMDFSQSREIIRTMYNDFVNLVHGLKDTSSSCSEEIRSCTAYIHFHLFGDLSIEALAKRAGYSTYYLSRKFKEEMGENINTYIKKAKIARAKTMLATTKMSIEDIAEKLKFGSRSFFVKTFSEIVHESPSAYRKKEYRE